MKQELKAISELDREFERICRHGRDELFLICSIEYVGALNF